MDAVRGFMAKSSYREARTPAAGGKKLHHIELTRGKDGGHVARHHFENNGMHYHQPEEHIFGDDEGEELVGHLAKHMGIKPNKEEATEGE
jgi:hypothetical protein